MLILMGAGLTHDRKASSVVAISLHTRSVNISTQCAGPGAAHAWLIQYQPATYLGVLLYSSTTAGSQAR